MNDKLRRALRDAMNEPTEEEREQFRQGFALVVEGICPICRGPLDRRRSMGYCPACNVGWKAGKVGPNDPLFTEGEPMVTKYHDPGRPDDAPL